MKVMTIVMIRGPVIEIINIALNVIQLKISCVVFTYYFQRWIFFSWHLQIYNNTELEIKIKYETMLILIHNLCHC